MGNSMELFYLGNKYYFDSATQMTRFYRASDKEPYDWEEIRESLDDECEISIRPPTEEERNWADAELATIKKEVEARR